VSWQIGTLVVLMLALGAGMLWYETSRPPSQIVALVAVLAALAVAGRIVLAPIPNVVATTDIVFFAGYALGPAPGFAVGALGGLVSNFWLGQGMWTPWQMLGWGMTGVAGGFLFHLMRGRANRFTLALACGAAGLVFGAWMNFQTMVSFGGEISLDRYLVLEVRAIPFDLAHMTGNVIFALAAGPTMVAALRRFRERFEWHQTTSIAGVLLVAVALTTVVAAPSAQAATTPEAAKAATWLRSQQNTDGGFPSIPGSDSSVGMTSRVMLGLAAGDINPLDVSSGGNTPLKYLKDNRSKMKDANDLALVILALKTVGADPRDFEGRDLVEALRLRWGNNGSYGDKVNIAAFAALAFQSANASASRDYVAKWLRSVQNDDGGWGISSRAKSDPDSTGTVLQTRVGTKGIRRAMKYLEKPRQKSSGGWVNGSTVNSQSTGLVVAGQVASGKGPNFLKSHGKSGLDFLKERQQEDGSVFYSKDLDTTRVWVTADSAVALAGESLPVKAPARAETNTGNNSNNNGSGGVGPGTNTGGSGGSTTTTPGYNPGTIPDLSGSSSSSGSGSSNSGSGSGKNNGPTISDLSDPSGDDPGAGSDDLGPLDTDVPIVPVAPSEAILTASKAGPQPSPLVAILICLVVSSGLAGGTILLARRFKW
jgi:energy-coupling factor transport system substrate-specific component